VSGQIEGRPSTANDTQIPRDPWGQQYRYDQPGRFNPGGYDVYSVHGNSRNPALWIGNWLDPFHLRGALEAEDLTIRSRGEGVTTSDQKVSIASFPPLSGGRLLFVRLQREGDSISLALPPSVKPGRNTLRVRFVTSWDYAIVQTEFNGEPVGRSADTYTPKIDAKWVDLGTVEVGSGDNTLALKAVARNPKSLGYCAGIDAVILAPVP